MTGNNHYTAQMNSRSSERGPSQRIGHILFSLLAVLAIIYFKLYLALSPKEISDENNPFGLKDLRLYQPQVISLRVGALLPISTSEGLYMSTIRPVSIRFQRLKSTQHREYSIATVNKNIFPFWNTATLRFPPSYTKTSAPTTPIMIKGQPIHDKPVDIFCLCFYIPSLFSSISNNPPNTSQARKPQRLGRLSAEGQSHKILINFILRSKYKRQSEDVRQI
jgi:hypothetical protein